MTSLGAVDTGGAFTEALVHGRPIAANAVRSRIPDLVLEAGDTIGAETSGADTRAVERDPAVIAADRANG